MANYILSNANRFYVAIESSYGIPAPVAEANRFAAARFDCHQNIEVSKRRDKTGSRTYRGTTATAARRSAFELSSHFNSWDGTTLPSCGALLEAAMGAAPELVQGLVVLAAGARQLSTELPHGLTMGSAISNGAEVRFVASVLDSATVTLNAPFSVAPGAGTTLSATVGYRLATQLPSVTLYDYWDPQTAVSRMVTGAGVDKFQIEVRGDVHELLFSGPAADVLDSGSGAFGSSGLAAFPTEPPLLPFEYSIVDGQLGQVWLGSPLNQVFTLTEASIEINNHLLLRNREFGSAYPRMIVPGPREVLSSFTLFAQSDAVTEALYAAAKAKTPISAFLQLGQQKTRMMAVYLPNVVPELPLFKDSEAYLLWEFKNSLAQGESNDEVFIAFA